MKSVSAIIPAYNEECTVGDVVKTAVDSGLLKQVICINDGSTDRTLSILRSFGRRIVLVNLPRNQGKGSAIVKGISKAKSHAILFLDSDLVGLTAEHLRQMICCFYDNHADGVLGNPVRVCSIKEQIINPDLKKLIGLAHDVFTGQRIYRRKDVLPLLGRLSTSGNSDVAVMNHAFSGKKILFVDLIGLNPRAKHEKTGFSLATVKGYTREGLEISKELLGQKTNELDSTIKKRIKPVHRIRRKLNPRNVMKWVGRNLNP